MANASGTGKRLSETELFDRWGNRWGHFVDDFAPTTPSDTVSELLRDKVKSGNAERAIAGGHEGREILELLQNARDAILRDGDRGRVYMGVYDEGVLVANTGRPFDMFDPDVEDAVTMIGESAKDDSDQEIGHKGVGLKSILATGESFEIWSRHDHATGSTLRVRLSRAYITAALLSSLGKDTSKFDLRGEIVGEAIGSLANRTITGRREKPLSLDTREDIGKLPLFDFPVPLTPSADTDDLVANRASALLSGDVDEWYGDPFRTAVFIEYEDDEWRTLLDAFDIPHPDPPQRDAADRAERLWSYLSKEAGDGGLTAETVVQFGGIETMLLERIDGNGNDSRERWDVTQASGSLDSSSLDHEVVTATVDGGEETLLDEQFDQFRFDDRDASVQLLVPRKATDADKLQEYPLYLYYPIENTRDVSLPYCLHGHFTVETNRKDLSLNSLETNQSVLSRGVELVGLVAETAARHDFGDRYPWILLPPPPENPSEDPSSQPSLLTWFRARIFGTSQLT